MIILWLSVLMACSVATSCLAASDPGPNPLLLPQPNTQPQQPTSLLVTSAPTNTAIDPGVHVSTVEQRSDTQEVQPNREYYLVTPDYTSPPGAVNPHYSKQKANNEALVQQYRHFLSPSQPVVTTPVQYRVQIQHTQENKRHTPQKMEQNDNNQSGYNELRVSIPINVVRDIAHGQRNSGEQEDQLTTPLIQVFTDHNCTRDETGGFETSPELATSNRPAATGLYTEIPSIDDRNVYSDYDETFGAKVSFISSGEKGNRDYRTEFSRAQQNSRSERVHISTIEPPTVYTAPNVDVTNDGITRLVASTQDLVSNDDLLDINHAAEDETPPHNDDLIKPKTKTKVTKLVPRKNDNHVNTDSSGEKITVRANIGKVIDRPVQYNHLKQEQHQAEGSMNYQDKYSFATPIVVQGSMLSDFKSQIMDNIVSTVIPYLDDGYELAMVRNDLETRKKEIPSGFESSEASVKVTPRPLSQKFLAPLTVGLRLLNSNNSEVLNYVDGDHVVSDSEVMSDAIEQPDNSRREKTIVEVQRSIPIELTDINDVVVHHYNNREGKMSHKELRSLHHKFNEALASSRKIQDDMNQKLYRYGAQQVLIHPEGHRSKLEAEEQAQEYQENMDSRKILEASDIQTEVEVQEQGETQQNERKELIRAYNDNHYGEKIIQPIIIEKEVPVTKFVDRFIEKKVPYPQPVEVIKEVSVEKPVPYPVTVERIVDRPVEVTRYVDRPRDVMIPHPVPVPYQVRVPYPVEKKVYVDRPVHFAFPIEKVVEKRIPVPVPTPVGIPVEVPVPVENTVLYPVTVEKQVPVPYPVDRPVPVDRIVEKEVPVPYPVEKKVPYPVHYETRFAVPYPVETRVPYPVDRIIEKPYTITKYVEKPVHVGVPVPQPVPVPVPQPYPVHRFVEKRIPYPVDRVVEKIVEKKVHVNVPYPVERIVEKIVTKYVDGPYPVEKTVPYPVPHEKIIENNVPYPVEVKVPFEVKVPYPVQKHNGKPVDVPFRAGYRAVEKTPPSYEIPGPPYLQHSAPQNYVANIHHSAAFLPPPPTQQNTQSAPQPPNKSTTKFHFDKNTPSVKTTQWGNLHASSYQYIKPIPDDDYFKKTPNLGKYINYLTNNNLQYIPHDGSPQPATGALRGLPSGGRNEAFDPPRALEWKLRRADRTARLRIEYGGFRPPLVPSTRVDLDGLPVPSENIN